MAKRKQLENKKRSTVRERDWEANQDKTFSHDLSKHRRALAKLPGHCQNAASLPTNFATNATIIGHSRKWAFVKVDPILPGASPVSEETRLCLIDEQLREDNESLLAPGDRVLVEVVEDNPVIRGVAPRATRLARHAGEHGRVQQQVIAANADLLIIVAAAANPPFRPGLVDRFLIAAQHGGVLPLLCLNKIDLVEREPEEMDLYRSLDLAICVTSCKTGEGLDELRSHLAGKTSVMAGHSGVGKSSILNHLDPELRAFTREISEATNRGRHATTAAILYELQGKIRIIDTPGIRALGLWDISPEEVAFYFPELAASSEGCKFRNCTHIHETRCAVKEAVEQGLIARQRYESYKRIRASLEQDNSRE